MQCNFDGSRDRDGIYHRRRRRRRRRRL